MERSLVPIGRARYVLPATGVIVTAVTLLGFASAYSSALPPRWDRTWAELSAHPVPYLFLAASLLLSFVLLGWLAGRRLDGLRADSLTDALTALPNRRYLDWRLAQELGRAARSGDPISVLLVDADNLKEINDREGHQAGDAAIVTTAQVLRESSRTMDVATRYGGDEFVVIMPNTPQQHAIKLAQRIQTSLQERSSNVAGATVPTVSIGIASTDLDQHLSSTQLLQRADQALYEAKAAGPSRMVIADTAGAGTLAGVSFRFVRRHMVAPARPAPAAAATEEKGKADGLREDRPNSLPH